MEMNWMVINTLLLFISSCYSFTIDTQECDCDILKFTTKNPYILRKYEQALGSYNRVKGVEVGGRAVWLHKNENYFLYYANSSSKWAVGEVLGGDVATLENRGDTDKCPDGVRSSWSMDARLGDGDMYDDSMRVTCMTGACAGLHCGHNARCDTSTGQCVCNNNYNGDPLKRCFPNIGSLCNCQEIALTTSNRESMANQADSFGTYFLDSISGGYPVYKHHHGSLFLYQQDGSWLISNKIGSRAGGVQNQGDPSMCPYRFKTTWEYADVSRRGWQWSYDYEASMVCATDGCSVTKCGHRATCTDLGGEGSCSCDIGFDGNPYRRCYPIEVPQDCSCTKISVSSSGEAAATQSDKMGNYYLYGYHDNKVVYQHQSGLEFLFHAHGQAWAIGANVGGLRVGIINFSNTSCPYNADTIWKYSTQGQLDDDPSLIVTCDKRSIIHNPIRPETEPPVTTTTTSSYANYFRLNNNDPKNNALPQLAERDGDQVENLLYKNYVNLPPSVNEHNLFDTTIPHTTTETSGIFSVPTGDKGIIKVHQMLEERPTKIKDLKIRNEDNIPDSFFDHLSNTVYGEENSVIDDQVSGESYKIYLVSTTQNPIPNKIHPNYFETSRPVVRTPRTPVPKLRSALSNLLQEELTTTVRSTTKSFQHFLNQLSVKPTVTKQKKSDKQTLHPAYTSLPINYDKNEGKKIVDKMMEVLEKQNFEEVTSAPQTTRRTTTEVIRIPTTKKRLKTENEYGLKTYRGPCNCSKLIMTSNNPTTISKHGAELGQYILIGGLSGRPVYKHIHRSFFLFYQPESGGNWLVNTRPGLMYGGIQNSKDYPVCPYLVSTVWQYGDSEVGGWVYDQSLTVTCPSNQCSVLKCGFRAECNTDEEGNAKCECKQGFMGDPYSRCYPKIRQGTCNCNHVEIYTVGPARLHQRDKMGDYFLWGYYNNHPVYQHYSGLDFLYFHSNMVWGVGPKVGGKRAGLLNFAAVDCPYEITSPWQFGTKLPEKGRQLDTHLSVTCITN